MLSYENWSLRRSKTLEKINTVFTNPPIKLITMEYPPTRGGAGVYCEELAHSAKRLGYNIEVWAPLGSQSDSSVNVKELPMKGSQDWACSWKIKKFLASQKLEDITCTLQTQVHYGQ